MKISIVGTGYVGLVTGVSLSEIGHEVTCIDIDEKKINDLKKGISPIYEPGIEELMIRNIRSNNLKFTTNHDEAFSNSEVIYIAVGTPENEDGSANLSFINKAAENIGCSIKNDVVVVTKSTVPVGTNDKIKEIIHSNLSGSFNVEVVSNPEFLREGSAIYDSFNGDRIVVGANSESAAKVIEDINRPFGIPVYKTDVKSAEMIKYASNAFLATKISFINEISNICDLIGANVEDVAEGMGLDKRIGNKFLKAGIGYGGSCFPKDTKALIQIAGNVNYNFKLLQGVIEVNKQQQKVLIEKIKTNYSSLYGKSVSVLGLAFKPETDDMREAPSLIIINELIKLGASVKVYDPVAIEKAKLLIGNQVNYSTSVRETLVNSEIVLVLTEWDQIKSIDLNLLKNKAVYDGRNCFDVAQMLNMGIEYYSIGRPSKNKINLETTILN